MLRSDSLVELTPQQVKEDRQWRGFRIGSLAGGGGGEGGTSEHSTRRSFKRDGKEGTAKGYLIICSGIVPDIHTLSPVMASTSADKNCTFFLSSSTINFLLNLKGK